MPCRVTESIVGENRCSDFSSAAPRILEGHTLPDVIKHLQLETDCL